MNKPEKSTVVSFLWHATRHFNPYLLGQVFVSIIWAIDLSLSPYLIKQMINAVSLGRQHPDAYTQIWTIAFAYLALSIVMVVIFRFYDWLFLKLNSDLKHHLSTIIMDRMLAHSSQFYQKQMMGSIINKINDTIEYSINLIRLVIDHFLSHLLAIIIAIATIWICVGLKFAIGLIVWVFLFLIVSRLLLTKAKTLTRASAETKSQVMGRIVDILNNIFSIHIFNKEKIEMQQLTQHLDQSSKAMQKRDWYFIKIYFFQKSSFVIFQGLSLWWLITGFFAGSIQAGDFALILIINASIVKCLWNLSRDLREFSEAIGPVSRGLEMIYQPLTNQNEHATKSVSLSKGEIVFNHVHFGYENKPPLFQNVNISIKAHEKVGIVGYSGSGKSSFMNLIMRIYDIHQGEILIDGHDIRHINKTSLLNAISVIPQNPYLFNRSILENIRFGNESASFEEVVHVAQLVCLDDLITSLPLGYHTMVGEKGLSLSGGQRQRVLIARAILKKSPIFLLDEATNELDVITDNTIQESLRHIMNNATTLVIAHRLSTLISMDRILVFDQGKIIQDGTHQTLLQQEGLYKTLWSNGNGVFLPH